MTAVHANAIYFWEDYDFNDPPDEINGVCCEQFRYRDEMRFLQLFPSDWDLGVFNNLPPHVQHYIVVEIMDYPWSDLD